jgi:spore germination protein YaaH
VNTLSFLRAALLTLAAATAATAAVPAAAAAQPPESIWYIRNNDDGIRSFAANARHISVIAPQVYSIDSAGTIRGGMDPRIVTIAREHGVRLMPLVMNPGFDLGILHHIVTNTAARTASAHSMAEICRRERVHGIQLDFENLHVSDRDAFTAFAREVADSVHRAGCELSAAVVPRTSDDRGVLPYHGWMMDYWRSGYDYKALAESLDFLSYMTYAQHAGGSTPGPVAGYPWMVDGLRYVLAQGVPPHKLSLGIPAYSDYWHAGYNARTGDVRPRGNDIAYPAIMAIIDSAGARPRWDNTQKAWYAMWERHGVFEHAWIEDARAFKDKLRLVKQHRLRGYSVWLLGLEDPATWRVVGPVRTSAPGNARNPSR